MASVRPASHAHAPSDIGSSLRTDELSASLAERRTLIVAAIAAATMVVEVCGGVWFGSMALLADGLHMASHTMAMGIAVFAYGYARRHAASPRFAFGTGKVNALGGYGGALLLAVTALWMIWESAERMWHPGPVKYGQAILLALGGLLVNLVSAWLLRDDHHTHGPGHLSCSHAHDHNLRTAYLHVLADALTSALAIAALMSARAFGLAWLDPLVGIGGGGVIAWWSIGLLQASSSILLDHQAPALAESIRDALERDGDRIADLRCWAVAPGRYAVAVRLHSVTTGSVTDRRRRLIQDNRIAWSAIEVAQ